MEISHVEMMGKLLGADPPRAVCDFTTLHADGDVGETGSLQYASRDRWILDLDHAGRTLHTPEREEFTGLGGERHTADRPTTPSYTSAVALLLPRYAAIYGRRGDDWSIDETVPIRTGDGGSLQVVFQHREDPRFRSTAHVHPTQYCITAFINPAETRKLTNLRFELTEEEEEQARRLLDAA
ncbi:hypothetical protein [Streptomyces sp. NPDC050738]|uniref:hypothetical protein n=1 Tax=Streptomyces sp. NPDC050738 TaxID=3154744 RepID=UPI003414C6C1